MAATRAWPWGLLALALAVAAFVRAPLALNAANHLDSDLAVDGLTLLGALHGHWRWHYPGTPHVGTASLAVMVPIGLALGASPRALGIAGVMLYLIVVVATFALALRAFGRRVAAWSLVPLAFASTGTIWLSGRITGGHLLATAWHAAAFGLLYECLSRGGVRRAAALGLWCGLGVWNDSMALMTVAGVVAAGVGARARPWPSAPMFIAAFAVGLTPHVVGRWVDPYDAYHEQFAPIGRSDVLLHHARILAFDCLPRLVVGHRLPGLEAEPGGIGADGRAMPGSGGTGAGVAGLGLGLFLLAVPGLAFERRGTPDPGRARWAVRWGLLVSSALVLAGFVVNRNIYNSDNYRYLVLLLVPWSVGFGRLMAWLSTRGQGGAVASGLIGVAFAAGFALDAGAWYRRLGWLDDRDRPVARPLDDPALAWLDAHPDVNAILGDYWDVYRLAFLTGGRVEGVPSAEFPDRFPERSRGLPGGHPDHALARPTPVGSAIYRRVVRDGGRVIHRAGDGLILAWPAPD